MRFGDGATPGPPARTDAEDEEKGSVEAHLNVGLDRRVLEDAVADEWVRHLQQRSRRAREEPDHLGHDLVHTGLGQRHQPEARLRHLCTHHGTRPRAIQNGKRGCETAWKGRVGPCC